MGEMEIVSHSLKCLHNSIVFRWIQRWGSHWDGMDFPFIISNSLVTCRHVFLSKPPPRNSANLICSRALQHPKCPSHASTGTGAASCHSIRDTIMSARGNDIEGDAERGRENEGDRGEDSMWWHVSHGFWDVGVDLAVCTSHVTHE